MNKIIRLSSGKHEDQLSIWFVQSNLLKTCYIINFTCDFILFSGLGQAFLMIFLCKSKLEVLSTCLFLLPRINFYILIRYPYFVSGPFALAWRFSFELSSSLWVWFFFSWFALFLLIISIRFRFVRPPSPWETSVDKFCDFSLRISNTSLLFFFFVTISDENYYFLTWFEDSVAWSRFIIWYSW